MSDNHDARFRHLEDRLDNVEQQLWEQTLEAHNRKIRATVTRYDWVIIVEIVVLFILAGVLGVVLASVR